MNVGRHLLCTRWALTRRFHKETLDAIETAIASSETMHRAEIRFAIEAALDWQTLWRAKTARDRALEVFGELQVWNTAEKNGVLMYLLLAEHGVEIVADRGLDGRVTQTEWSRVCADMQSAFTAGRWRDGAVEGVAAVGELLAREFPGRAGDKDELANRPAVL